MIRDIVLGQLRHGLTTAGGALLSKGVIDSDQANAATGALMVLAGVVWSAVEKILADRAAKACAQTAEINASGSEHPLPIVTKAP